MSSIVARSMITADGTQVAIANCLDRVSPYDLRDDNELDARRAFRSLSVILKYFHERLRLHRNRLKVVARWSLVVIGMC